MNTSKSPAELLLDQAEGITSEKQSNKIPPPPPPPASIAGDLQSKMSQPVQPIQPVQSVQSVQSVKKTSNIEGKDEVWKKIINTESTTGSTTSLNETLPKKIARAKKVVIETCKTKGVVALLVFFIVSIIMAIINPPIVHKKKENELDTPKTSVTKILSWGLVAGFIAFVIPIFMPWAKKQKNKI
jgi:hypothetical protein